jgi:uncharacterized protein involved in outer membrane biogenesis
MTVAVSVRRILIWPLAAVILLLLTLAAGAMALDAGYLRHPLIALLAADTDRHIQILGSLQSHVFSRHPHFVAEHVQIGNPSWMPAGITAQVDRVTLELAIPGSGHLLRVDRLVLEGATLYLVRDMNGRANWQLSNAPGSDGLPLIRGLSIPKAHAMLNDARRHLDFDGIVSVQDLQDQSGPRWLRISGGGQLNGAAVQFETLSDPLLTANHRQPYHFTFAERSRTSHLSGRGALAHAFDFDNLQTQFDAAGENLQDLYALTGVRLIATGGYRLSGSLQRHGTLTNFSDLEVTSGMSDASGKVSVDSSSARPALSAELHSRVLRLSDLGERAARRESATAKPESFLLSEAALSPDAVRHGEADVTFRVQRLDAARVSLHQVAGKLKIDHGILTVSPFAGQVLDGQFDGRLQMNATGNVADDALELHFHRLQIGQLDHNAKGGPRYDALLDAQVSITGHGSSLHQIGASANGRIAMRLDSGTLRESLAELSGMDIRGLGLMLTKSGQQAAIRCGAANIQAREGTLSTDDVLIDTDDVRISGEGTLQLDSEALHLDLRGHPKQTRLLRVKAPVLINGTLLHPRFGLEHPKSLQLIDRGSTKIVDCASLLAH